MGSNEQEAGDVGDLSDMSRELGLAPRERDVTDSEMPRPASTPQGKPQTFAEWDREFRRSHPEAWAIIVFQEAIEEWEQWEQWITERLGIPMSALRKPPPLF